MGEPRATIHAQRCNTDKQGLNTVADSPASFAVLTGEVLAQEFEAKAEERYLPMRQTDHAPVLDASFVQLYLDGAVDPPPAYRFLVRVDPEVEDKMKRKHKITLRFAFQDHAEDPDQLETTEHEFGFDWDADKTLLDGYCYLAFLFVCGDTEELDDADLGEIRLFDVSDDSAMGFPAFLRVWPGDAESAEALSVPLVEMLPEIDVSDYLSSDLERYLEAGDFPDADGDESDFEESEQVTAD